jgi:[citrate (pro-3S)-lyase] ligase
MLDSRPARPPLPGAVSMIPVAVPLLTAAERLDARRFIESHDLAFEDGCDELVGIYDTNISRSSDLAILRSGNADRAATSHDSTRSQDPQFARSHDARPRLVAVAARSGYVLKMFALDDSCQGGEALGALVTSLTSLGRAAGHDAFLVFTRPEHARSFEYCGFRLLVTTSAVALLECGGGLDRYLRAHRHLRRDGTNGAVVINGNPFTCGHQYLVATAAAEVDTLYVFIVREDKSAFPFAVRRRLADEATRDIPNLVLLDTSRYAVSVGTFPSYFLRRNDERARLQMEVDVRLFAAHLAPAFGITKRFVGHEPYCETTAGYNQTMKDVLPEYGISLVEVERTSRNGRFISATDVRAAIAAGDLVALEGLVPPSTLAFVESPEGAAIAAALRTAASRRPKAESREPGAESR